MKRGLRDSLSKLIASIEADNNFHGGLLSRQTIRCTDELRLALSRENESDATPAAQEPQDGPREAS